VVVTVIVTVALAPPLPETRYVHVPAASGANENGPAPAAGETLAMFAQVVVVSVKPPVFFAWDTATLWTGTPAPAAVNASDSGVTPTAVGPGVGVGGAVVPLPIGAGVPEGAAEPPPPPPQAASARSAAAAAGGKNTVAARRKAERRREDARRRVGVERVKSDIRVYDVPSHVLRAWDFRSLGTGPLPGS
jgi:hypothetical protein